MYIGPLPLFAWIGVVTLVLAVAQVLTGRHILKVNFRYHRVGGYLVVFLGIIHGLFGLGFLRLFQ